MTTRHTVVMGTIGALFTIGLFILIDRRGENAEPQHPDLNGDAAPAVVSAVIPFDREHFEGQVLVPRHEARIGLDLAEAEEISKLYLRDRPSSREQLLRAVPAHSESMEPFFIDPTEVSKADFLRFVRDTPGLPRRKRFAEWADDDLTPANNISAVEADRYANWCGRRLPTAREWEAAARFDRSGKRRYWPWGDTYQPREGESLEGEWLGDPQDVALRRAARDVARGSSLGLLEMAGNVAEWTGTFVEPYVGFRNVDLERFGVKMRRWRLFSSYLRELRGGHDKQSAVARMTTWRWGAMEGVRSPDIGFRTVVSQDGVMGDRYRRTRDLTRKLGQAVSYPWPEHDFVRPRWRQLSSVIIREGQPRSAHTKAEVIGFAPLDRWDCGEEFWSSGPASVALALIDLPLPFPGFTPGFHLAVVHGDRLELRSLGEKGNDIMLRGRVCNTDPPRPWVLAGHDGEGGLVLDVKRDQSSGTVRFVLEIGAESIARCRRPAPVGD